MTTNPSIHERVKQAIERDAELLGRRAELQQALLEAKQAEDGVRLSAAFKAHCEALKAAMDAVLADAQAKRDAAAAKAEAPFLAAGERYKAALAVADGAFAKIKGDAETEHTARLTEATRAREIEVAEARATVHRAQQELAAHQTTIDQHRRQIQDRLGINMERLLE